MPSSTKAVAKTDEPSKQVISETTLREFAMMVTMIPEADSSEATERMLLAILRATRWDEVDDAWDKNKATDLLNHELRIDEVYRRPSRFAGGLGVFLVVKGFDKDTELPFVFPTSSIAIVGELTKLYALNAYPVYAYIRQADNPSANGFYPQHLEVFASMGKGVIDATEA